MPMIDAFIPEGALESKAETRLFKEITDILLRLEGLDPANQKARDVTVIFLHRPSVLVAGSPTEMPRYRFIVSVPEGQYDDESRKAVVKEVTDAVARAEGGTFDEVGPRVWVFPVEIADGSWEAKLANRRRDKAVAILDAAREVAVSDQYGVPSL